MRQAQVLVYESDGKLTKQLRELCTTSGWRLREARRANSVLSILREGVSVLVIRVGRDLFDEMALLERVSWSFPETETIIAGDVDHPDLIALAWDLGAAFVLLPPHPQEQLARIVAGFMAPAREST